MDSCSSWCRRAEWTLQRSSLLGSFRTVPSELQGTSARMRSKPPSQSAGKHDASATVTRRCAQGCHFARLRSRAARSRQSSLATSTPAGGTSPVDAAAMASRSWQVLLPGALHRSKTASPGRGASASAGSIEALSWTTTSPAAARTFTSSRPTSASAAEEAGAACSAPPEGSIQGMHSARWPRAPLRARYANSRSGFEQFSRRLRGTGVTKRGSQHAHSSSPQTRCTSR
mmetsp:Transcript_28444/g.89649  ORF Transcript_28444/g.89649 Transcript_28444/m.89649 type:complete len:229 (+) Transcript_28444:1133-1819(+)